MFLLTFLFLQVSLLLVCTFLFIQLIPAPGFCQVYTSAFLSHIRKKCFLYAKNPPVPFSQNRGIQTQISPPAGWSLSYCKYRSFAYTVRHHKLAAFAAFYEIRSSHFPVCSSFISSSFGRFILRADWHVLHLLKFAKDITDFRHSWI